MKRLLCILLCGTAVLTLSGCKKKNDTTVIPAVTSSSKGTPYKEPVTSGGGSAAIIDEPTSTPSSKSSRFNYISTSEVEEDYEVEDDLGGVNILRYRGEGGKIYVPSVIGGKSVLKIDEHAFRGTEITNVIIPGAIRTIETHAFSGCDKLEQLTIGDGVKTLEDYAFADCPKLTLVSLPDSLKEIGTGAFRDCPNIMITYKGQTYTITNVDELYEIF